jgi:hypothetical protein
MVARGVALLCTTEAGYSNLSEREKAMSITKAQFPSSFSSGCAKFDDSCWRTQLSSAKHQCKPRPGPAVSGSPTGKAHMVSNNYAVQPNPAAIESYTARFDPPAFPASALAYCPCLSDNYPHQTEVVCTWASCKGTASFYARRSVSSGHGAW